MHLTYPSSEPHIGTASPAESGEAGAPETEIEITAAMIDRGIDAFNCRDSDYDFEDERVSLIIKAVLGDRAVFLDGPLSI
jgi:hypothetical protein